MGKSTRSGIAVGLNKGFITTELGKKNVRARPSHRKGILGKRTGAVR
jgi:large subunit ribosomal protein L36e